eukprot:15471312-Alexandrium_andersonii.AAC.1
MSPRLDALGFSTSVACARALPVWGGDFQRRIDEAKLKLRPEVKQSHVDLHRQGVLALKPVGLRLKQ